MSRGKPRHTTAVKYSIRDTCNLPVSEQFTSIYLAEKEITESNSMKKDVLHDKQSEHQHSSQLELWVCGENGCEPENEYKFINHEPINSYNIKSFPLLGLVAC